MQQAPAPDGLPPGLRFLKALVIVLTLTMIGGVITVVTLLVTRMPAALRASLPLPEAITLPAGARALAITTGPDWFGVVTTDNRILIFDRASGVLRQEVLVQSAAQD
jgi:hypothetical protein